jgi:hypothetical protein
MRHQLSERRKSQHGNGDQRLRRLDLARIALTRAYRIGLGPLEARLTFAATHHRCDLRGRNKLIAQPETITSILGLEYLLLRVRLKTPIRELFA